MTAILRWRSLSRAILLVGLTGCTHLETRPTSEMLSVEPGAAASEGAQLGLSYPLPMVQYDIKARHRLETCPGGTNQLKFSSTIETSNRYVAGERFEVDYRALSSVMKTTNFNLTFHESGTLRSINATARDRTGPILADVARIGVAVASIASGNPAGILLSGTLPSQLSDQMSFIRTQQPETRDVLPVLACTEATERAIRDRQTSIDAVKRLTTDVTRLTEEVTRYAVLATAQAAEDQDRRRYRRAVAKLLTAQNALRTEQATLARREAALSVQEEIRWPTQAGGIHATDGTIPLTAENRAKLTALFEIRLGSISLSGDAATVEAPCPFGGATTLGVCVARMTELAMVLQPAATQTGASADDDGQQPPSRIVNPGNRRWARGIFVREPAQARLAFCRVAEQPAPRTCSVEIVHRDDLIIAPQYGRLRLLPFTNGPFEEGEIKLTLRADGTIESFSYGEESSLAGATANLATIAERIDTGLERIETEQRSDIQYARDTRTYVRNEVAAARTEAAAVRAEEIAQLTHERDMLLRRREVIMAEAGLSAAEIEALTTPINAELAQLNARIGVLRSTNDLTALQAAQAGQ